MSIGFGMSMHDDDGSDLPTDADLARQEGRTAALKALPPRATLARYRARLDRAKTHVPDPTTLGAQSKADRPALDAQRRYGRELAIVLRDYEVLLEQVSALPRGRS